MRTVDEIDDEINRVSLELRAKRRMIERIDKQVEQLKEKLGKLGDERAETQTSELI